MSSISTTPALPVQEGVEFRQLVWRGDALPGYAVGNNGSVWSAWRRGADASGRIEWGIGGVFSPLKPAAIARGRKYLGVSLRAGGRTIRASIHRLVAEAFLGPCPDGLEVCHEDGDGHNNRLSNLRYGTKASNVADKVRHGTDQNGERNPAAKLSDEQAEEIRQLRAGGAKLSVIAVRFRVRESTVSRIANGIRRSK